MAHAGRQHRPPSASELSSRRTTFVYVKTLLWKNWLLKKRHPVATLLEVALPCVFVLLLSVLKNQMADIAVPAGWSDTSASPTDSEVGTSYDLFQPTGTRFTSPVTKSLPKFYMHETSVTGLLATLGIQSMNDGLKLFELSADDLASCNAGVTLRGAVSTNASSPYKVPDACAGKVVPYKIAIAPETTFTREYFMQTMDQWYPRVALANGSAAPTIPSWRDSVMFFKTADEIEAYVQSPDYGTDLSNPRVYAGIVFDQAPSDDDVGKFTSIEYTIRMNSTMMQQELGAVPRTNGDPAPLYPFQKKIQVDYYSRYAVNGFMTLQTLVTRFVACMPKWDATKKQTSGACQNARSTAISSDVLDARLLATLGDDARLQLLLRSLNSTSSSLASLLKSAPSSAVESLLKPLRQAPQPYLGGAVAPFPIDAYTSSSFYDSIKNVFAILFVEAYLYCVSRVLVVFIQEKESRMREFMKILGVKEKAIVMSWYITYGIILFIGALLQTIASMLGVFANSSPIIIFLFFYLFGLSVLAFAFLVSTLFSKARAGSFVGMIVFFVMYFVSTAFSTQTPESSKTISCLLPPVSLSLGVQVLANLEATGQGVTFSNINIVNENFRFSTTLLFFVIDTVLYTLLGLYFEKVIPKDYGTTLKWYFPVSPSYWRGRRSSQNGSTHVPPHQTEGVDAVSLDVNAAAVEPVSAEFREQVRTGEALVVQQLRKVFSVPGGEKTAVKRLDLTMYKDQITCLLGHNGAGKTTLISMLTGMIAPTSGSATYKGMSFTEDMDEIRQSLGICFQHDVLFAELTVEEHLIMFASIKGYSKSEVTDIVARQIREVGLTEKRHVKSNELSGGMKRKLSVAVSLLGDSSLVFLDEPTSGMDPYSRRSTWEILLNNRNDRVMVLTTHFMDEADILGDRIAIMSEGELRCCGSSLFLKNRYGAGYNLTLVKDDKACNDADVVQMIKSYVPTANVLSNVGSEIAFQLPLESSFMFATLFSDLDNRLVSLGLLSYGVSVTTLEEVFIKVAEAGDEDHQHTLNKSARAMTPVDPSPYVLSEDADRSRGVQRSESMFSSHLHALLLKRFRVAKRDRRMLIFSTLLPVLLLLVGLALLNSGTSTQNDPKLALTTAAYPQQDQSPVPFTCVNDDGKWCNTVMASSMFTGALPASLDGEAGQFSSTSSPSVFGVTYASASVVNSSAITASTLSLGQAIFNRGYGRNGQSAVLDQLGAFLVHGEGAQNVFGYNVFVNSTATHGAPIFKALADQALYRFFASNSSSASSSNLQLTVNSHPLPLSASSAALFSSFTSFAACLFIAIAFTFFPASIVTFLVKEKQSDHNAKHQQLVSGVSLGAFWLSNYLWDLMMYVVPCGAALVLIQLFNVSSLTGNDCITCSSSTFPAVILLFVLFGLAICPFTYCLSYLFKEHASSQTYTIMINFIIGMILMVVSFVMDVVESTADANKYLLFIWRLSPLFSLGNGLLRLTMNDLTSIMSSDKDIKSPFDGDLMGYELLYLAVSAVAYGSLAVGIDYALTFPKIKDMTGGDHSVEHEAYDEDVDVAREAERVGSGGADADAVVIKQLRKVYKGGKVAVRNLSFGLKRGDCFGFLGINGAGKTTTMKMLTGDVVPSSGTATLSGFDILTQQIEVRRQIGYCPQFDALFDLLTVREHLELFARIKGTSRANLNDVVTDKIHQLNLASFENKLAGSLSGGNKRKLSVAIALIGNPQIVFLDEPSTGMDPVSRRFMWDVIAGISTRSKSSTIVLTTHSMEESEALCSRVGIMVGGRLRCLGSVQHLKNRFGDGLVLDVKMAPADVDELDTLVQNLFGGLDGDQAMFVTEMELLDKCRAFGAAEYAQRIVPSHPTGYSLAAAIERDGFVRAPAFCAWLLEEKRFDALEAYLQRAFGETNVVVMERQNDFSRFKLRGANDQLKLSKVFERIERVKPTMHIREYSVSQTTLEQIFNQFASQQAEEQGGARGMMHDAP